jgi:putative lipoic acid-binding regulatory protein
MALKPDRSGGRRTKAGDRQESLRLLNETHDFPTSFMFKSIGRNVDGFAARVVVTVRDVLELEYDPPFRVRETAAGRHVSVTVEPEVKSAEQVLAVYACLQRVAGVVMLL